MDEDLAPAARGRRTLRVYFIKPSQYDRDGTVLQFRWGVIPNNTLTVLAALNEAFAASHPTVDTQTVLWDELVDGAVGLETLATLRRRAVADGAELIIGLTGIQTGQYPRARDVALQCKQLGLTVVAGGFHISGDAPSREFLADRGVTVVVGEAETTWGVLLEDYLRGELQRSYHVTDGLRARTALGTIDVPDIGDVPLPVIDSRYLTRFFNPTLSTIDTARGCPFACSYCAVKNVMGRTMRARDPNRVVEWVRDAHDRHGIRSLFIVDDDFYRSPCWEPLLTGLAALRREGRTLSFMMQADVESAIHSPAADTADTPPQRRSRRFVELAAAAGCYSVFIGFESFNPANLDRTLKVQNQPSEDRRSRAAQSGAAHDRVKARYRTAVDNWHRAGVAVHAGYMVGLPFDGMGSGAAAARDLTDIGVDIASFFPYTPLPGTEDYDAAYAADAIVERDFNAWDCLHVVNRHPTLTPAEVYREYCDAHRGFYTWKRLLWSLATGYGVAGLSPAARYGMLTQQLYYTYAYRRGWHPMMGGIWRVRDRSVRRQAIDNAAAARIFLGAPIQAS
jgi:radical SAM superfamily enzyme YgiQ (UPF0313 family)